MALLKHKDTPQPGTWRTVDSDELKAWRRRVAHKLSTRPRGSVTYEADVGRTQGLTRAPSVGDEAVVEAPARERGQLSPREAVDALIPEMAAYLRSLSPELLRRRVADLKAAGHLTHLTDDQAVREVQQLAEKLAVLDAERVYKLQGFDDRYYKGPLNGNAN